MADFDIATWLQLPNLTGYLQAVDHMMGQLLVTDNPYLNQPLARLLKHPGKRLRPTLLFAAALSQGQAIDQALVAAGVSVELIHLGSLVHDDLIDNAASRRSVPTINSREGSPAAVLVGDYLLAKACETGSTISGVVGVKIATTIAELCAGQSQELADQFNLKRTPANYLRAISGKTAALLVTACQIGGLIAGSDATTVNALAQYGQAYGISFQLIDDLVDIIGSPKALGKPIGTDIRQGVYTIPVLLALQGPSAARVRRLINQPNGKTDELAKVLLDDGSIQKTLAQIYTYSQAAHDALATFDHHEVSDGLRSLPQRYFDWSLQQQVALKYRPTLRHLLSQNAKL